MKNYSIEINKFAKLADQWWSPNGPNKVLHAINPLRLSYISSVQALPGLNILDIGCGGGILSSSMQAQGGGVTGFDPAEELIATAKDHAETNKLAVTYRVGTVDDAYQLYGPDSFEVITCMELLEHVPAPEKLISTIACLLKPAGKLFFSTLNKTWQAYTQAIIGAEYLLRLLPIGTHEYRKFIEPATLYHYCAQSELELKDLRGIRYTPLFNTVNFTASLKVNYIGWAIKAPVR